VGGGSLTTVSSPVMGGLLFTHVVFSVGLGSLVFQAMLGGVPGTTDGSCLFGGLAMLSGSVVSFFFSAIGTSFILWPVVCPFQSCIFRSPPVVTILYGNCNLSVTDKFSF